MDLLSMIKLPSGADTIVMWVIALNFLLSGIGKALDVVKDKTKGKADNKAADVVHKATNVLQKVVDFASANRSHKDK